MASPVGSQGAGARLMRWLPWWQAFLAFSGYVTAAGVLSNVMPAQWAALCLVINGGLNQATGALISRLMPAAIQQAASGAP